MARETFPGACNQWAILSQESQLAELRRAKVEPPWSRAFTAEIPTAGVLLKSHVCYFQKAPQWLVQETIKRILQFYSVLITCDGRR